MRYIDFWSYSGGRYNDLLIFLQIKYVIRVEYEYIFVRKKEVNHW